MPRVKKKKKVYTWKRNVSGAMLRRGQIIRFGDPATGYRVEAVNDCRAIIRPLRREQCVFRDKLNEQQVTFSAAAKQTYISAQSEVEIMEVSYA